MEALLKTGELHGVKLRDDTLDVLRFYADKLVLVEHKAVPVSDKHEIVYGNRHCLGDGEEQRYRNDWVIVNRDTAEVFDDAQGYGYKSIENAIAAYNHKYIY